MVTIIAFAIIIITSITDIKFLAVKELVFQNVLKAVRKDGGFEVPV